MSRRIRSELRALVDVGAVTLSSVGVYGILASSTILTIGAAARGASDRKVTAFARLGHRGWTCDCAAATRVGALSAISVHTRKMRLRPGTSGDAPQRKLTKTILTVRGLQASLPR